MHFEFTLYHHSSRSRFKVGVKTYFISTTSFYETIFISLQFPFNCHRECRATNEYLSFHLRLMSAEEENYRSFRKLYRYLQQNEINNLSINESLFRPIVIIP